MLLGFIITKFLPYGHHSYWVLLTISVILKPAFSLTKQRNIERIGGTLTGGLIGVFIFTFVPNKNVQFGFMVLFMLGTYSAQRINYNAMVICVTPFILILFSFLGVSYLGVAEERFLDTIIGGIIALAASYAFFPRWESEQLVSPCRLSCRQTETICRLLFDSLSGQGRFHWSTTNWPARIVFVTSANLGAAFDRMLSEPKNKQRNEKLIYEFVVLNHILSANIATLMSTQFSAESRRVSGILLRPVKRALFTLTESLQRLDTDDRKTRT